MIRVNDLDVGQRVRTRRPITRRQDNGDLARVPEGSEGEVVVSTDEELAVLLDELVANLPDNLLRWHSHFSDFLHPVRDLELLPVLAVEASEAQLAATIRGSLSEVADDVLQALAEVRTSDDLVITLDPEVAAELGIREVPGLGDGFSLWGRPVFVDSAAPWGWDGEPCVEEEHTWRSDFQDYFIRNLEHCPRCQAVRPRSWQDGARVRPVTSTHGTSWEVYRPANAAYSHMHVDEQGRSHFSSSAGPCGDVDRSFSNPLTCVLPRGHRGDHSCPNGPGVTAFWQRRTCAAERMGYHCDLPDGHRGNHSGVGPDGHSGMGWPQVWTAAMCGNESVEGFQCAEDAGHDGHHSVVILPEGRTHYWPQQPGELEMEAPF